MHKFIHEYLSLSLGVIIEPHEYNCRSCSQHVPPKYFTCRFDDLDSLSLIPQLNLMIYKCCVLVEVQSNHLVKHYEKTQSSFKVL